MHASLFSVEELAPLQRFLPAPDAPSEYRPPTEFPTIKRAKRIAIDIETADPDLRKKGPGFRRGAYIVGVAVNADDKFREYYPMRHVRGPNCDAAQVESWLADNLNNFRGELTGANLLYDFDGLQYVGVKPAYAKIHDIQIAEPLIDEHALSYSLETLAQKYLGQSKATETLEELYGPDVKLHFQEVHPAHAREYALPDVILPGQILDKQKAVLAKEHLTKLFDLESRLLPLLLHMRRVGVRVDLEAAERAEKVLAVKRDQALLAMQRIVGFEVDPDSNQTIARACEKLGVDYPRTLPTASFPDGQPSFVKIWLTNAVKGDWLDELSPSPSIAFFQALLDARRYQKAINPFIQNYVLGSHVNGRLHALFHPLRRAGDEEGEHGTVSGRLSSSNPNLQNIPTRDEEIGPLLRALFIPNRGKKWGSADYSQFEYRILIHFACKANWPDTEEGDAIRRSAFEARDMYRKDPNTDFHALGAQITGLAAKLGAKAGRKAAKAVGYGISYGMGIKKLGKELGHVDSDGNPTQAALDIMDQYNEKLPFVKALSQVMMDQAQKKGYVTTILGRRARFSMWEENSRDGVGLPLPYEKAVAYWGEDNIRRAKTYKALNYVDQGSNGDAIKQAMVTSWEQGLTKPNDLLELHLTVHDELDASVDPSDAGQKAFEGLQEIMRDAVKLEVPVLVDGKIGDSWAETH